MDARQPVVLIVDDEPAVMRLTRAVLRRAGFEVLVASSAIEAQAVCRDHAGPIDAALLDVTLPDLSGPELFVLLAQIRPELGVVFMGGYPGDLVGESGLAGAPFVQKPFNPGELVSRLREVLGARSGGLQL